MQLHSKQRQDPESNEGYRDEQVVVYYLNSTCTVRLLAFSSLHLRVHSLPAYFKLEDSNWVKTCEFDANGKTPSRTKDFGLNFCHIILNPDAHRTPPCLACLFVPSSCLGAAAVTSNHVKSGQFEVELLMLKVTKQGLLVAIRGETQHARPAPPRLFLPVSYLI
jgi:hypothetical protein